MPNLKEVQLVSKANVHLANAEKVSYNLNKVRGQEPKTANVTIYDIEFMGETTALPDVFDIINVIDDGIVQKRVHILNCSVKATFDDYVVAIAKAPDATE